MISIQQIIFVVWSTVITVCYVEIRRKYYLHEIALEQINERCFLPADNIEDDSNSKSDSKDVSNAEIYHPQSIKNSLKSKSNATKEFRSSSERKRSHWTKSNHFVFNEQKKNSHGKLIMKDDLHSRTNNNNYTRLNSDMKNGRKYISDTINKISSLQKNDRKLLGYTNNNNTSFTSCISSKRNSFLYYKTDDVVSEFNFTLEMMTDENPHETSWTLLEHDGSESVLASNLNDELLPATLHRFEYDCSFSFTKVNQFDTNRLSKEDKICYDFIVNDARWSGGFCCENGLGYFNLYLNNIKIPSAPSRSYGKEVSTTFCVNRTDGTLITTSSTKLHSSKKYPSRECKAKECICDTEPVLFANFDDDRTLIHNSKMNVMTKMMFLSGPEKLLDSKSPQYKAACWVLNDDNFYGKHREVTMSSRKIEERMIQRYILAIFYFATTPENWNHHHHFLSSRSECQWNTMEEFHNKSNNAIYGILCNEDEEIFSINFSHNNLDGTIAKELFTLISLEQFVLFNNEKLFGSIPPEISKATNLEHLNIARSSISGSIPESIGNLKKLPFLSLFMNDLTGPIPESIYSLNNMVTLSMSDNLLSSTISTLIGNLRNLKWFDVSKNSISGEIPSSIIHLSKLEKFVVDNNDLSGLVPNFLTALSDIGYIALHDNKLKGVLTDEFCEMESLGYERNKAFNLYGITADCRDDVFEPQVKCSCCNFCSDKTPSWEGDCADTSISVIIHHKPQRAKLVANSYKLKWALIDSSTGKTLLNDGPYTTVKISNPPYRTCIAKSGCYSLNLLASPDLDTDFSIYFNDKLFYDGTFFSNQVNHNEIKTSISFYYDTVIGSPVFGNHPTCGEIRMTCGDDIIIIGPNTTKRSMYNLSVKISGSDKIQDKTSNHSRALCWILRQENDDWDYYFLVNQDLVHTRFTQRYILTLLHLNNPLFGTDNYPPQTHECQWPGISCGKGDSKFVTTISLSAEAGQKIDGPLIQELGNLPYLEKLQLSRSKIRGSIPEVFSNLWGLKELNLAGNAIEGSIPDFLFQRLEKLEFIDLSDNFLSGSIPKNIGSKFSLCRLMLGGNKLTGYLPFESFRNDDLMHVNVSTNQLSSVDFFPLLRHRKLKTLDLSNNFFVGSLHEGAFTSLAELEYFDISQNEFSGIIPSTFPELSYMIHFDMHSNQFKGPIPSDITKLSKVQHINLQGNKLTGSLPNHLNHLKSINTLVLSHNELKGSIPELNTLENLKLLHLHNNKLSGEAPELSNMDSYIADCGYPYESVEPLTCVSCDKCCNADDLCQENSQTSIRPMIATTIFLFVLIFIILICYILKDYITSNRYLRQFFTKTVDSWNALMILNEKSVYHFLLTENKTEWYLAISCVIFQIAMLFLFVQAADLANEVSDQEYTMLCPANSLDCEDSESLSSYGYIVFGLILSIWLFRDIVSSMKLMLLSIQKKNIDFFFASAVIFTVTMLSLWTSVIYILAIAIKDTDLIKDAVILLFVIEIDERIYQLIVVMNADWVDEIEKSMNYNGDDLVIRTWLNKFSDVLRYTRKDQKITHEVC